MAHCIQCGHQFDIGRFCTNCGHPVAEPPSTAPPTTVEAPERPRFPLYADEVADEPAPRDVTAPLPVVSLPPVAPEPPPDRRGPWSWWPWLIGLVALALVAVVGAWLLGAGNSPENDGDRTASGQAAREARGTAKGADLSAQAAVSAPPPAPPNQDTEGNPVSYVADHLVDGVPETCWRVPGDATGESISFRFEEPVVLTEIGLVNGYAKSAQDAQGELDWYAGNRRVLAVEWTFDDGTLITQELDETRELQTVSLDDVRTEVVTLRLLEVSEPGTGPASRDYTAISEVALRGTR